MNDKKLLEVKDLHVSFFTPVGEVKAVGGISYDLGYNEVMGIVGESGSGKSVEAYSIIGLLQSPGKVTGGEILFEGRNVLDFSNKEMQNFRGNEISMIFQNPMTCLNPVYTVPPVFAAPDIAENIFVETAYHNRGLFTQLVAVLVYFALDN